MSKGGSFRKRAVTGAVFSILAVLLAAPANADVVRGSFTGIITASLDSSDTLGFGAGTGVLNGLEVSGTITYDTGLAPSDVFGNATLGGYNIEDDSVIWMPLIQVTIGGVSVPVPTLADTLLSRDADQDMFVDASNGFVQIFRDLDYISVSNDTVDYELGIGLSGGSFATDAIPTSLNLADFALGGGNFSMIEIVNGQVVQGVSASFELTSLSLAVVPVPPAAGIGLIGMALVGFMHHRGRKNA